MSPPITTAAGLSRLIATASTSPSSRPLSRSRPRAIESPWSASATRSRTWSTVWPDSASRATSAQPPAIVSRQPVAPHRQGSPPAASTVVWPISPAAPRWPLSTRPSGDDAEPEAGGGLDDQDVVEARRRGRAARSGRARRRRCRRRAARRSTSARYGASSTPSQPVITGEPMLSAADAVEGAGQAEPDAEHRRVDAVEQRRPSRVDDRRHQLVRADPDLVVAGVGGDLLAVEVEHGELAAGAADGDGEHHAGVLVEHQRAGRPAAGRGELLAEAAAGRPRSAR